jgi:antitoxin protein of toxin-antitoxin system
MGFDEMKDKAKDMLGQHPDQAEQAVDKAKEFADQKTGGKHTDQLDSAANKAKETFRNDGQ